MSSPSPAVGVSLVLLLAKVETAADRAGIPHHQRRDTASTVAALPWPERRRLGLVLEGVRAQAQHPTLRRAAERLLALTPRPGRDEASRG